MTVHLIAFAIKGLLSIDWQNSNSEWEALGILHGLEKFHHYCFATEGYIMTEYKPLMAMTSKDMATLSQQS